MMNGEITTKVVDTRSDSEVKADLIGVWVFSGIFFWMMLQKED